MCGYARPLPRAHLVPHVYSSTTVAAAAGLMVSSASAFAPSAFMGSVRAVLPAPRRPRLCIRAYAAGHVHARVHSPSRVLHTLWRGARANTHTHTHTHTQPTLMRTSPAARSNRGMRLSMDVSLRAPVHPPPNPSVCSRPIAFNDSTAPGHRLRLRASLCFACMGALLAHVYISAPVMQPLQDVVRNFRTSQTVTRGASMNVSSLLSTFSKLASLHVPL